MQLLQRNEGDKTTLLSQEISSIEAMVQAASKPCRRGSSEPQGSQLRLAMQERKSAALKQWCKLLQNPAAGAVLNLKGPSQG
jgi:hypothetical protein